MLQAMRVLSAPYLATAADLDRLERHEVVGGDLMPKAAPSFEHGAIQSSLAGALYQFRGRGGNRTDRTGGWWLGTEVEIELEAHEVYLPDMAGWRIERIPEAPSGKPVRVMPDWVCEVLSPSTAGRDLGHKLQAYHRARVSHYWIIDPVHHTLAVYRWQEAGYLLAQTAGANEIIRPEPFEAIEQDTSDLFGLTPSAEI